MGSHSHIYRRIIRVIDGEPLPSPRSTKSSSSTNAYRLPSVPSDGYIINLLGIKLVESDLWFGGGFVVLASALLISGFVNVFLGIASGVLLTVLFSWAILLLVRGGWSVAVFQTGLELGGYVLVMTVGFALIGGLGVLMERTLGKQSSGADGSSGGFSGGGGGFDGGGFSGAGGDSGGGGASGSW